MSLMLSPKQLWSIEPDFRTSCIYEAITASLSLPSPVLLFACSNHRLSSFALVKVSFWLLLTATAGCCCWLQSVVVLLLLLLLPLLASYRSPLLLATAASHCCSLCALSIAVVGWQASEQGGS